MFRWLIFLSLAFVVSCDKKPENKQKTYAVANEVKYANGFSIRHYEGFTVLDVHKPWPGANSNYRYVLYKDASMVPDTLSDEMQIQIPVKRIVLTSTTHVPSLEMLGSEQTLIGFPGLDYISSPRIRQRIDAGHVVELGNTRAPNLEKIIELSPDLVVGFGVDDNNPGIVQMQHSGINVALNGDWNEHSPLGKAEWIKFFGAFSDQNQKAKRLFEQIEKSYLKTSELAKKQRVKPTVMAGAIYQNTWYMPEGRSWGAKFISEAGGDYLWRKSKGTGSLSLGFETVLLRAKDAEFWVGPAQYTSLAEMRNDNPHYSQFKAFQDENVYTFSSKKGPKGGVVYYELAPNRPDLVLKDLVSILHPHLLPDHELKFFERLR